MIIKNLNDKNNIYKLEKWHTKDCIDFNLKYNNDINIIITDYDMFKEECIEYMNRSEYFSYKIYREHFIEIYN